MLIVIEGLDGAGKSTQVDKVRTYLSSKCPDLKYLHFPRFDAPVVGDMIAAFLRGEYGKINEVHPKIVALLYAEDRRDASILARRWLAQGDIVLYDRYVYSNIAFQCAKFDSLDDAEELRDWIFKTEYESFRIPKPDLNIFLDVPLKFVESKLKVARAGSDRDYLMGKDDIHEADMDFQTRVRNVYLRQCEMDPNFIRIDCSSDSGEILGADDIFGKIKSKIDEIIS